MAAVPESLVQLPLKKLEHSDRLPEIGYAQTSLILRSSASEVTQALKDFILQVMDPRELQPDSRADDESQSLVKEVLEHLKI